MKKIIILITVVIILILVVACEQETTSKHLPTQEDYPFDRVMINTFHDEYPINQNVEMWEYVNEDTIIIKLTDGRTFMTDKSNVTFFTTNQ